MVGDCPPDFLSLAVTCCNMSAVKRPTFADIVFTLESMEIEEEREKLIALEPVVADVSPYRRRSSPCHPGDRSQQRLGLARSQSDMLPPSTLTPPLLGTPVRVNPFSLRQDLNGGRCKLLDTPSKSVISLTFTLPALRDPCASPHLRGTQRMRAPHRRCQSLPCTPELGRTVALTRDAEGKEEEEDEDIRLAANKGGMVEDNQYKETELLENVVERLQVEFINVNEKRALLKEEERLEEDSGLPVELDMVSLERLEEEEEEGEESVCLTEPMDCTKSPEPTEGVLNSTSGRPRPSTSLRTNGWQLPISNGPPSLPPLPRLDNNNGSGLVIGQQVVLFLNL
ncbi:uncharacterized protein [Paralichthys olivaceus]|uniref:uncharacterized protein n=1 Tax=Paralichthys olivaceus TaxID=8255 RepID=UPI0037538DCA